AEASYAPLAVTQAFEPLPVLPHISTRETRALPVYTVDEESPVRAQAGFVRRSRRSAAKVASGAGERVSAGDVAPEVQMLDRARIAIAAGERKRALTLLSTYRSRFPAGVLVSEAKLLTAAAEAL